MRKSVLLRLLAVVLLFTAAEAQAAGPVRELPPAVAVHVAIKSPLDTLAALDGYVANATRGSQRHMPVGSLEMIARIYLPIPLDTWEAEDLAEVFFLRDTGGRGMKPVSVIQVGDFDLFAESLEEKGWEFDEDELEDDEVEKTAGAGAPPFRTVYMPNGKRMVLALVKGGDNLVALAEDMTHIELALAGDWKTAPASDADIVVTIAGDPDRGSYASKAAAGIKSRSKDVLEALIDRGLNPEPAEGILAVLEKYAPRLVSEFDRLEGGIIEITLEPGRAIVDLGGKFGPDSLAGEMAGHLAKAEPVANPLEVNIPDSAISYSVTAPLDVIVGDAGKRIVELNGDVYGMFLPELAGQVKEASAAFFGAVDGGSVMANLIGEKGQYSVILVGSRDAAAAVKAVRTGVGIFNQAWAQCVADPDLALTLVETESEKDGAAYVMITPRPANPERFQRFMAGINAASRDVHLEFKAAENLRLFLAARDGMLVSAIGELNEGDFLNALSMVSVKAKLPMAEREAVKKLRPYLPYSQATVGFIDADGAFHLALEQWSRELTAFSEPTYKKAVRETLANLLDNGSVIGMSLGSAAGNLTVRFALPADAVNSIVRNYETFLMMRMMEEIKNRAGEDDETDEGDDEEEVDEDEPEAA